MEDNPQSGWQVGAAAHAAQEKATTEHRGAATGAQAVADAVKKVADAAVAEISKTQASGPAYDFQAAGSAGGRFELNGPVGTFGASGTVRLNGAQLSTREWSSQRIVGNLPAGSKSGEITVQVSSDTVRKGYLAL